MRLYLIIALSLAQPAWIFTNRCWAASPPVHFTDVTVDAGVLYTHGYIDPSLDVYRLVVGGVAAGDYDGDGWVDLYAVGGDAGSNHLFRNRGDGTFEDVADAAGVALPHTRGSGPTFADYDGDGRLDLFVGSMEARGPSLFHNRGDGTFDEVTRDAHLWFGPVPYIGAAFGDYDRDGDLDLFVTQWGTIINGRRLDHLWRNNGDGTFTGHTSEAGIAVRMADYITLDWYWSFTPNFADINNDGWPDLLLASDYGNSQVFLNSGAGTFTETTTSVISDENGMGAAVGDYDNDGDLDWFVSSIYDPAPEPTPSPRPGETIGMANWGPSGNRLYRNKGDGTFDDVTDAAGVRDGGWGWGSCFADFNNDGFLDLFEVNGWGIELGRSKFFARPARLFLSNGDGTFTERAAESGLGERGEGRGVVCFDYDGDGDIDIFVANNGGPSRLWRNDTGKQRHFLQVKLNGRAPNTEAIGGRIYVTAGGQTQMRELRAGSNYVSQDPAVAHFGLGSATQVDELRIVWPDQSELRRTSVAADQFLVITPPETVTPTPTPLGGSPVPTPSAEVTAAGDANCDGLITAADLTALVSLIATPQTLWCGADVNQDEKLDSGDVTALISTLFESL